MNQLRKMGKTNMKKAALTPRRRNSFNKSGGVGNIAKILSRPASSTVSTYVSQTANVRVIVRVRPPTEKEQGANYRNIIKVIDDQMLIFDPNDEDQPFFFHGVQQKTRDLLKKANKDINFIFDKVFDGASDNNEVFANSTKSLVKTLMNGYNCSVFAYGATGAGKTFTMIGTEQSPGITYLTMKDLFNQKEELSREREFELMVTYIEVYNELVKDLLNPGSPLNLREDSKCGVVISGVKGHKINSPEELFALLDEGNKRRTQHPTDANSESSRSHAVFQVYIQMTIKSNREIRRAKLSMIDLAGSERGSATGFVGARFKEGANINKSLLALGNCINSLADGKRHVPYRDSKLTRLLKDSLGGNCHTIMIANISPSSLSFDDTYNTLKYATRAKSIKASVKKNIVNMEMHVDQYIKLVEDLQSENKTLKTENANLKTVNVNLQQDIEKLKQLNSADVSEDSIRLTSPQTKVALIDDVESSNAPFTNKVIKSPRIDTLTLNEILTEKRGEGDCIQPLPTVFLHQAENLTREKPLVTSSVHDVALHKLINEQKELLERKFQLQSSTLGMSLRRKLKIESNKRLSTIFVDVNDKHEAHRKLEEQIDRSVKKEQVTQDQTKRIEEKRDDINKKITELLEQNPEMSEQYKIYKTEIELKYECKLKQKEINILLDDNKEKCNIIEKMASLMKPVFLAIGGPQGAPESVKKDYAKLIDYFQGKKNLSWLENETNECIHLCTDLNSPSETVAAEEENAANQTRIINKTAPKRKMECGSEISLDSTYNLLDEKKLTKTLNGEKTANSNFVAKVSKTLAPKRLACGLSPRSKANNIPYLKRTVPAARLASSRTNSNFRNLKGTKLTDRPKFRS